LRQGSEVAKKQRTASSRYGSHRGAFRLRPKAGLRRGGSWAPYPAKGGWLVRRLAGIVGGMNTNIPLHGNQRTPRTRRSIHAPDPVPAKAGSRGLAFLFLTAMAVGLMGAALVLGTEPRMVLERSETGFFRVTGSNHFAGHRFFSKTIEGVQKVVVDDAVRDGRRDSEQVNHKRRRDLHLEFVGANGSKLGWDRESDARLIEEFMRGKESGLSLADAPPRWRMGAAWFLVGLGGLTFLGAIQNFLGKARPGDPEA
jgi:hypothetical protein